MVTVKNPKGGRYRMSTHYLLLTLAACIFCGTFLLVSKDTPMSNQAAGVRGFFAGVDAHSASKTARKAHLVYGTAWKKDETARLVRDAVKTGFRFIDTACQPKHYNEAGVGNGWTAAAQELGLSRSDVWLQTKFTPFGGQDPNNIPYDPKLPVVDQARISLGVSLENLHTEYLDSWVLHSPLPAFEDTMAVWRVMEEAIDDGKVHQIGISNCYDMEVFRAIYQQARHKPKVLQNRFYADSDFDTNLRRFCKDRDIHYQSFWTLTANRNALATPEARELAEEKGLTPQTYLYAFLMSLGYVTPLSGTTSPGHMMEDVAVMERMQGGDLLFTEKEQKHFAKLLGMPAL
mmetsp:Transcript_25362/g.55706  ORF Transcript_25362/g.55706 Transcript_25362/m.55706 type:complete len:346 (+) Transcript_25362:123-1160(+)